MEFPVMKPTNRYEEFVAYCPPQRTRLRKSQVMRVVRHAATDEASLPHNELAVIFVPQTHRFAQRTNCDPARPGMGVIETGAIIGSGAILLPKLRIGAFAVVGAGAVVIRDVPPRAKVMGSPAHSVATNLSEFALPNFDS
jgi:hypothetical protein